LIPVCLNFAIDSQGKFAMAALIFFVLIFIALLHFNLAASVILFAFSQSNERLEDTIGFQSNFIFNLMQVNLIYISFNESL